MSCSIFLDNYSRAMPQDTVTSAGKSFVFSFALSTAFTGNPGIGFAAGFMAAGISLVSSASVPIFRSLWQKNSENWYEFGARSLLSISVVSLFATNFVNTSINFVATAAINLCVIAFVGFENRSMDKSTV